MNITELKKSKPSLGKGLSALLGESLTPEEFVPTQDSREFDISLLRPGKYQPRRHFDDEKLTALINSIREKGIIQPLVIRPLNSPEYDPNYLSGPFEIIAGERRWRAARTIGLEKVPAIIRLCDDKEALETALIENVQRDDLSPVEEAEGYQQLIDEFDYTQEQLAKSIGKSRSHIANMLRLNQLPAHVKDLMNAGKISAGHARTLITAPNMDELLDEILTKGLNVRETEKLAKKPRNQIKLEIPPSELEVQSQQLEEQISTLLNMKTSLKISKSGGTLNIFFNSYEEIDDLVEKFRYLSTL